MGPLTPFVLNSRDAWLPVLHTYGHLDQSSELYVYMTSDGGNRWTLRGRFPGRGSASLFFLNHSVGFMETDGDGGMGEDPAQIYTTHDGGKHWREVSAGPRLWGREPWPAAQVPSATTATRTAYLLLAPGSASPLSTATSGRRSNVQRPGP